MKHFHFIRIFYFGLVLFFSSYIYKTISDNKVVMLNAELLGIIKKQIHLSKFMEFWPVDMDLFISSLKEKADINRTVIISIVDDSFIDMAINLYETSFLKHNITNYIFLCAHIKATKKLLSRSIDAISVWNDRQGELLSVYGTLDFSKKNLYKTVAATIGLKMGYKIIVMDTDIVLLKNPNSYLACNDCDMIFTVEENSEILNAGFYVGFPTRNTILIHEYVIEIVTESNFKNNEQFIFNSLFKKTFTSKIKLLDQKLFQNGRSYFELGKRMFAGVNPCFTCVSVHNNYILSYNHKVYRFKEHLLWMPDAGKYYSSTERKYIMYENKYYIGEKETMIAEMKALKNAFLLGYILNRTVILPKFFCYLCKEEVVTNKETIPMCAANIHFNINTMDKYLKDKYRENMFLLHPKVPDIVKSFISRTVLFETKFYIEKLNKQSRKFEDIEQYFSLRNDDVSFTIADIVNYLRPLQNYSVIKFHSLYGNLLSTDLFNVFDQEKLFGVKSLHFPNYKIIHFLNTII